MNLELYHRGIGTPTLCGTLSKTSQPQHSKESRKVNYKRPSKKCLAQIIPHSNQSDATPNHKLNCRDAKKANSFSNLRSQHRALEKSLLSGCDAEFLLERYAHGNYKLRIGQLWRLPKVRGQTLILLDLDDCKRANWREIFARCSRCGLPIVRVESRVSPSGKGLHIAIHVRGSLSRFERIALQAILESDPIREANNFRRAKIAHRKWDENWNVLYV